MALVTYPFVLPLPEILPNCVVRSTALTTRIGMIGNKELGMITEETSCKVAKTFQKMISFLACPDVL